MSNIRLDLPLRFRSPVNIADSEWLFNQAKSQAGQELFVIAMTQGKIGGTWLELGCGDPIRSNNTYLLEKRLRWTGVSIDLELMDGDIETPFEEYWSGFYNTIRKTGWPEQALPPHEIEDPDLLQNNSYYKNFIQRQITDLDLIPKDQRNWPSARPGTQFYQADALTFDYSKVPNYCDYLQIDLDPSICNLNALQMLLPSHRFGVITFEHDAWDGTAESQLVRSESRAILKQHGYEMVVSDVTVPVGHGNGIGDAPINFEDWWVDPSVIPRAVWSAYQDLDASPRSKYFYHILFTQT